MDENIYRPFVLIIDGNESVLNSVKEDMRDRYGIDVDVSPVFSEGIKKAESCIYDAIVSDIDFFGEDAVRVMKEKRKNGLFTPFIAVSGEREGSFFKNDPDNVVDFHLYKSGDAEEIYSNLSGYINKSVELARARKNAFMTQNIFPVVWENSPNGLLIINRECNGIPMVNPAFISIFGIKNIDKLGCYHLACDPNINSLLIDSIKNGRSGFFETEYDFDKINESGIYRTSKTGKIDLEIRLIPLDNTDLCHGMMVFVRDITERKNYERELSRANKKIGLLSGITRHDILNQVSAIGLYSELLLEHAGGSEEALGYIRGIDGCIEKIQSQINFTKDYENLGSYRPSWQNLDSIVNRAVTQAVKNEINFISSLGSCEVYADQMLEMVFFNLFDNSLRHGKTVTEITVSFNDAGDDGIIVYEDNGEGVPERLKEDIFLKGFGSNTGYGLFLIREILDFKGFLIKETGVYGRGARFEIRVPKGKWRNLS